MNVIFLGSPGSGKGTQSSLLKERLGVVAISSGQMLREAARSQTDLGKKAESYISVGRLVPDNMMMKIMQERLNREDCKKGCWEEGCQACIWPVLCLSPKGITISDLVYVSASPDARCADIMQLLPFHSCEKFEGCE